MKSGEYQTCWKLCPENKNIVDKLLRKCENRQPQFNIVKQETDLEDKESETAIIHMTTKLEDLSDINVTSSYHKVHPAPRYFIYQIS